MEEIPLYDPTYFTIDRDWSLLSFLLYRQQCDDFTANECDEYCIFENNGSGQVQKNNNGVTSCVQPPTLLILLMGLVSSERKEIGELIDDFWTNTISAQKRLIPTSLDNLEHTPKLIRTLLCLRYNVIKKIEKFKKFEKEGQQHIIKPTTKYVTGFTPNRPRVVTFAEFLPNVSNEETNRQGNTTRGRGRGRGRVQVLLTFHDQVYYSNMSVH
ncbi:hypothetical protein F8M41_001210 [Gigaspora margarita]|uniref:Uncharacterized protein n=1 Tax=Gigaspora margarita TaxID=4874 RepID=A0A8H3XFF2_GIGMA|nr:hypothetical protein F8M41_001210 [Gigaspora margarita]